MANIRIPAPGDDYDVERTVAGLPAGQTITRAWLTVKTVATDPDVNAVVQLEITTTATAAGQITDDGAGDQEGKVLFQLNASQTRAIGTRLRLYDIQIRTSASKIYTLETGDIAALAEEVTQDDT